jgi:hypothetical protein
MKFQLNVTPSEKKLFRCLIPAEKYLDFKGEIVSDCNKIVYIVAENIDQIESIFHYDLYSIDLVTFNFYTLENVSTSNTSNTNKSATKNTTDSQESEVITLKTVGIAASRYISPLDKAKNDPRKSNKSHLFQKKS